MEHEALLLAEPAGCTEVEFERGVRRWRVFPAAFEHDGRACARRAREAVALIMSPCFAAEFVEQCGAGVPFAELIRFARVARAEHEAVAVDGVEVVRLARRKMRAVAARAAVEIPAIEVERASVHRQHPADAEVGAEVRRIRAVARAKVGRGVVRLRLARAERTLHVASARKFLTCEEAAARVARRAAVVRAVVEIAVIVPVGSTKLYVLNFAILPAVVSFVTFSMLPLLLPVVAASALRGMFFLGVAVDVPAT